MLIVIGKTLNIGLKKDLLHRVSSKIEVCIKFFYCFFIGYTNEL